MAAPPPPPPPIYNLHNAGYFTQQIINDINMRYPAIVAPYTDVAIRRAYRELARVWHPDHAAPPGTPPATLEIINSNFQFLQTARDNLLLSAAAGLAPAAPAFAAPGAAAPPPPDPAAQRRRDEYMGMPEFLRYLNYYRVPQSSVDNPILLDSWINDYMEAKGFKPLERKFENTASKLQNVPAMSQFLTLTRAQPYSKTEMARPWRPQPTFEHVILTYSAQNQQGNRNFDDLYNYYDSQILKNTLSKEEFKKKLLQFIVANRRDDLNDLVGGSRNKRRNFYSKRLNNKRKSNRKKNKTGKKRLYKRRQTMRNV